MSRIINNNSKLNNSGRKMSLVACFKCKKYVDIKSTVLCSVCANRFELCCDGYPEQTYRLLSAESKKNWRCKMCVKAATKQKTAGANAAIISNITIRKKQKPSPTPTLNNDASMMDSHVLSDSETLNESHISPNKLSKSLDGTLSDLISLTETKETLLQCKTKLNMTEQELDNLILENNSLHKQIEKLITENNTLKLLCQSSTLMENTPNSIQKRALTQRNAVSTPVSSKQNSDFLHISNLERKIQSLQQQLNTAEQEITDLTQQIISLTQRLRNNSLNTDTIYGNETSTPLSTQSKIIYSPTSYYVKQPSKSIYIFGAQQCVGLAATIMSSRRSTKYDKYRIIAETKPNAMTCEIVKNCGHLEMKPGDKLIVNVGENDDNVRNILSQLRHILYKFHDNTIIVLGVAKNYYLDTIKLNKAIKNICAKYKNCNFVNTKFNNLYNISASINYLVDYSDYSAKYLNPKALRQLMCNKPSNKPNTGACEPKKGTIPYYFNRLQNVNIHQSNTNVQAPEKNKSKGTIPFYFPIIKRNNTFFRN
ncbi:unnamed protein product [Spodoptera littoralis]|uniref:Zinc finger PHD-type domain-containing protein n=1 Tax=Spodoptera littoralis TaxID=7109 RepID=A0A9P0N2U7_SPOLI|nr:unnamed protein product [Spodoptera littoralis]